MNLTTQQNFKIWQQNLNRSLYAQEDMLSRIDPLVYGMILMQEPHIDFLGRTRANGRWHVAYLTGHLDNPKATRAITLISTKLNSNQWAQDNLECTDVIIIWIRLAHLKVRVYNIYNDCNHDQSLN
ncbi:hypothetical protein BJ165DRAFT_1356891, partial [Panaeolus papilionaceus]